MFPLKDKHLYNTRTLAHLLFLILLAREISQDICTLSNKERRKVFEKIQ